LKVSIIFPPPLDGTRPVERCYGCNYGIYFLPHLPTLYIATILSKRGMSVRIQDFAARGDGRNEFEKWVLEDDSDVYLFYTVFLSETMDLKARDMIRAIRPKAKFLYCGTQPTWRPDNFLDKPDSYVVRGEADFAVTDLLEAIKTSSDLSGILGISYIDDGDVHHNASRPIIDDIDTIPIPDRSFLDRRLYYNPKMRHMPQTATLTSRGCFGRCTFCVPNSLSFARELEFRKTYYKKPPPRLHSVKRVAEEFKEIRSLGFRAVSIIDDEFLWNEKRTLEICEVLKPLELEWSCLARPDMVTPASARAMAESGCVYVDLGVESFDQRILDAVRKDMQMPDIVRGIKLLRENGIQPEINVLLAATPLETRETILKTIKMTEKFAPEFILYSIASPFPGTEFYYQAREHHWFVTPDNEYKPVDPQQESIISYPHLSKQELDKLVLYAYLQHYFRPTYLLKQLIHLRSFGDLVNKFSTALRVIRRNLLHY